MGIGLIMVTMVVWRVIADHPLYGVGPLLVASVVLWRTPVWSMWDRQRLPDNPTKSGKISRNKFLWVLVGFLGAAYISWASVNAANPSAGWLLLGWVLSILICLIGFIPIRVWADWAAEIRAYIRSNRAEWLTVLLISGIGLVIRVVGLSSFPDMLAEDEGYFASQAANLNRVDHWVFNPFRYDVHGHPLLFHVMQAASIDLLGQTVTAVRLPSALIGTLTIASTYFMARVLFDRRIALISAIFMMTFPLHVHFSRLALNQVMDAFWSPLS